jgi:hypothetical protein
MDNLTLKRDRMGVKDWITTTLAVCAFILSLPNAYNFIARVDDLKVVVRLHPGVDIDFANARGSLNGDIASFVFINTGNRPAAITGIRLAVAKRNYLGEEGGCVGATLNGDFEPFVVKEHESFAKTVRFVPATRYVAPEDVVVVKDHKPSFPIQRELTKDYIAAVCFSFDATFQPGHSVSIDADMTMTGYPPDGGGYDTGGDNAVNPVVLRQWTGTIFSKE